MFTTQFASYPESVVSISRRSGLVALLAAALAAVLIAVSLGSGNFGHSTTSLPQVRDMAPAWTQGHVTPRPTARPWPASAREDVDLGCEQSSWWAWAL